MTMKSGRVVDLTKIYNEAKGKCCLSAQEVRDSCRGMMGLCAATNIDGYPAASSSSRLHDKAGCVMEASNAPRSAVANGYH